MPSSAAAKEPGIVALQMRLEAKHPHMPCCRSPPLPTRVDALVGAPPTLNSGSSNARLPRSALLNPSSDCLMESIGIGRAEHPQPTQGSKGGGAGTSDSAAWSATIAASCRATP